MAGPEPHAGERLPGRDADALRRRTIALALAGVIVLGAAVVGLFHTRGGDELGRREACPDGRPLVVTGDASFPPFAWLDAGEPRGFNVDFLREVARTMGCSVDLRLMEWAPAMDAVPRARADLVLGITDLDERRAAFAFTDRLLTLQAQLFVRQDEFHLAGLEDLAQGAKVGVQRQDVVEAFLRAHRPDLTLREYADQGAMLEGLAAGEVEAAAGDYYTGRWNLHRRGLAGMVKPIGLPFLNGAYGLGVKKGNDRLLSALNLAIARVKTDGTARRLQDRWFGERFWDRGLSPRMVAIALGVLGGVLLAFAAWNLALRAAVRRATRELRRSEHQLLASFESIRESEERFRALVSQSPDAIVAEVQGRVAYANPAAAALLGVPTVEALVGSGLLERVHPDDRAVVAARLRAPAAPGDRPPEVRVLRPGGAAVRVELTGAEIRLGGIPADLAVLRDVTQRHELEGQLRQAQKMEAVGRLAGGVAHDFNNLLTVIQSACESLGPAATGELAEDVSAIRDAADRASALTRQLLAFSRRTVLQPRILDLNATVADAARLLGRLLGEHVALETRCAPGPLAVHADPDQLSQVVLNLALNARDAMPAGGHLTLETREVRLEEGRTWADRPVPPGDYAELAVSDDGVGMDEVTQQHLFEPFFTTKAAGKGTGLGLSVVYGVVAQSGGHVELASAPGRGTTFRIRLPRADAQPARAEPGADAGAPPRGAEAVLVVEDSTEVAGLIRRTLTRLGYRVLGAAHPDEALEVAGREPDLALAVIDMIMPGMDGGALARRLSAGRPGLKVLFMSGYARSGLLPEGAAFLAKPFTSAELARQVRAALDGAGPPGGAAEPPRPGR